jgi:hypothetical protein
MIIMIYNLKKKNYLIDYFFRDAKTGNKIFFRGFDNFLHNFFQAELEITYFFLIFLLKTII